MGCTPTRKSDRHEGATHVITMQQIVRCDYTALHKIWDSFISKVISLICLSLPMPYAVRVLIIMTMI